MRVPCFNQLEWLCLYYLSHCTTMGCNSKQLRLSQSKSILGWFYLSVSEVWTQSISKYNKSAMRLSTRPIPQQHQLHHLFIPNDLEWQPMHLSLKLHYQFRWAMQQLFKQHDLEHQYIQLQLCHQLLL